MARIKEIYFDAGHAQNLSKLGVLTRRQNAISGQRLAELAFQYQNAPEVADTLVLEIKKQRMFVEGLTDNLDYYNPPLHIVLTWKDKDYLRFDESLTLSYDSLKKVLGALVELKSFRAYYVTLHNSLPIEKRNAMTVEKYATALGSLQEVIRELECFLKMRKEAILQLPRLRRQHQQRYLAFQMQLQSE